MRLVMLLATACGIVLVTAGPVGLLTSAGLNRSLSLGFYFLGSLLVLIGLLGGSRGPLKSASDDLSGSFHFGRRLRRATPEELKETISVAAVVIALGLALVVIGVAIDSRYKLL